MATNDGNGSSNGVGGLPLPTVSNAAAAKGQANSSGAKKKDEIGQTEFLTLLVNQLQNQDPLNPMESQEFAVQLAQFSSLEQLIQINKKVGSEAGGVSGAGGMASFLGMQVTLKDGPITIAGGQGPDISVDVPAGTQSARIDLMDENGKVVASQNLSEIEAGKQVLSLENVKLPNGNYDVRVVSVNRSGQFTELDARRTGIVEGFVLDPEQALLINGEKVSMDQISEVVVPSNRAG